MLRRLLIALALISPFAVFAGLWVEGKTGTFSGSSPAYVVRVLLVSSGARVDLPKIEGPTDVGRPLVVIDAGHGGHDPGASGGEGAIREKDLTLALALALRDALLKGGGVRVAMVRSDDRFLALEERSKIAAELHAGVFLSIHADAAADEGAAGATVYTLSAKASNDEAAAIADRENKADQTQGADRSSQSAAVNAILTDLALRQTAANSAQFADLIVREAQGKLALRPNPRQSAAFIVLKSADIPSVLFEAGYISNATEARRLASTEGRAAFATALDHAVRAYFARQTLR